eukprot:15458593-Alexandrium_andersonii.AAC.1
MADRGFMYFFRIALGNPAICIDSRPVNGLKGPRVAAGKRRTRDSGVIVSMRYASPSVVCKCMRDTR